MVGTGTPSSNLFHRALAVSVSGHAAAAWTEGTQSPMPFANVLR